MVETRVPIGRTGALTRRKLITGGAAILGGAWLTGSLAGCSQTPAGVVPLAFWHLLSGGDGIRMSELVDQANEENPDAEAVQTVLTWGPPYYTKLAMASAGGRGPDVAIMHASRVPGYAPGGLLDAWDTDLLAEFDVGEADFPPLIWEKGFSGDQLYAICLDIHPFILMYNTDIAGQAGALDADGKLVEISSPEQFLEVANAMSEVTGGYSVSYGYLNDGAQLWRMWYTFYKQLGADIDLPEGGQMSIDEDAAVTSIEFMQQILNNEIANSQGDYATAVAEFAAGSTGMFFTGVWELPTMQGAEVPLGATTIPTLFGTPAAYADSHSFVLPRQSVVDEVKRRDTYRFVADILKNSIEWAGAGHVPAFLPVTESPEYATLEPQADYADATEKVNYDPVAWFTGSGSDFQNVFGQNLQPVLLGGADPRGAIQGFTAAINTLLSRPSPV